MPNKFFPVSIDLNNKNVLVIGAGKIALRKVETLLKYNCNIKVITKTISEEKLLDLESKNKILITQNQNFEDFLYQLLDKPQTYSLLFPFYLHTLENCL